MFLGFCGSLVSTSQNPIVTFSPVSPFFFVPFFLFSFQFSLFLLLFSPIWRSGRRLGCWVVESGGGVAAIRRHCVFESKREERRQEEERERKRESTTEKTKENYGKETDDHRKNAAEDEQGIVRNTTLYAAHGLQSADRNAAYLTYQKRRDGAERTWSKKERKLEEEKEEVEENVRNLAGHYPTMDMGKNRFLNGRRPLSVVRDDEIEIKP